MRILPRLHSVWSRVSASAKRPPKLRSLPAVAGAQLDPVARSLRGTLLHAIRPLVQLRSIESHPSEIGSELLWDAVMSGELVVLASCGPTASEQAVRAWAARLNAQANADCAVVVRMDAPPSTMSARTVRVFGKPFLIADTASLIAVALRARIFPVFAHDARANRPSMHVGDPFYPRGTSEVALQRTGQRLAWALERFARQVPGYAAVLESACSDEANHPHPECTCRQTTESAKPLPIPLRPRLSVVVERERNMK